MADLTPVAVSIDLATQDDVVRLPFGLVVAAAA
jgi:hypothetical protein